MPYQFSESVVFKKLPAWNVCEYRGEPEAGIQRFRVEKDAVERAVWVMTVIRREEDLIWKSCHEMLSQTVKMAAQAVQGFFGFELLALDLGPGMKSFQWNNFGALLVNHARALKVGEEVLVRYTSLYGILKKRIPESWGKIEYKTSIKTFLKDPAQMDLGIKKMLEMGLETGGEFLTVFHDLSVDPIFKFGQEEQTARLHKTLENYKRKSGTLPEIFILNQGIWTELGDQFGMRSYV